MKRVKQFGLGLAVAAAVASTAVAPAAAEPSLLAWGANETAQLGDGTNVGPDNCSLTFMLVCSTVPVAVSGASEPAAVAAGTFHTIALLKDGSVMAWGDNDVGQLGNGTTSGPETCEGNGGSFSCSRIPTLVGGLGEVKAVAAGENFSLALLASGTVMAWGANYAGQLGDGGTGGSAVPVAVRGLSEVIAVAAAGDHSLALLRSGAVMAWGANEAGQLGDGTVTSSSVPVAVSGIIDARALAAGGDHSLALLESGAVLAWGANQSGQLGDETTTNSDVPVPVSGLRAATAIAAGGASSPGSGALSRGHSLAVMQDGTMMAWGENGAGQLGDGTASGPETCKNGSGSFPCSTTPVPVTGENEATSASAGAFYSLALQKSGAVAAWGYSALGELGDGTTAESDVPVAVDGLSGATAIAAGRNFAAAIGTLAPLPSVSEVTPAYGSPDGGTTVTISGTNLSGASAVRFGAKAASQFTVNSPSSLTAVSPPGSNVVNVTVTTPSGTSGTPSADRYSYSPAITRLAPRAGSSEGGTVVAIAGTNFTDATAVMFGSAPARSFVVNADNSITAVSPAGSGTAEVTVTTAGGSSPYSSAAVFSYLQPPEFGRCVKVAAGTGEYAGAGCSAAGGAQSYEWYPGAARTGFKTSLRLGVVVLGTASGATVMCSAESGVGEYTGSKTVGGVVLKLAGCARLGEPCATAEAPPGQLVTKALTGTLGIITRAESSLKDRIGLDLVAGWGAEPLVEFKCGPVAVSVRGSVIVPVPANAMRLTSSWTYAAAKGRQKPEHFVGEPKDVLEVSLADEPFEQAALTMKATQANEEAVEVNSTV